MKRGGGGGQEEGGEEGKDDGVGCHKLHEAKTNTKASIYTRMCLVGEKGKRTSAMVPLW